MINKRQRGYSFSPIKILEVKRMKEKWRGFSTKKKAIIISVTVLVLMSVIYGIGTELNDEYAENVLPTVTTPIVEAEDPEEVVTAEDGQEEAYSGYLLDVLKPEAVTFVTLIEDYRVELIPNVCGILHGWGYHFPDGIGSGFDIIYFEITIENLSDTRFPINSGANFRIYVEGEEEGRFFAFSPSTTREYRLATQVEPQAGATGGGSFPIGTIRGGADFQISTGDVITHLAYGEISIYDDEEIWETLAVWEVNIEVPAFD